MLTLSEGRELLKHTGLSHLTDEEVQEVLESVKTFCEMCFDHYLNGKAEGKILPLNSENNKTDQLPEAA